MRKELFGTGKTVDAAIDIACEKLGCLREDCEWEIIDLPKKGFLGLKNIPAKVRVSIELPDEKPQKATIPPSADIKMEQRKPLKQQTPRKQDKSETVEKIMQEKLEITQQKKDNKNAEHLIDANVSEKEALARDYLSEVVMAAGLKAELFITHEHGGSCINIVGEGLGMIIGRRGETLDAIQYLAGLVANRGEGDYLRLTVDCGDYRLKRKGTLESLADKISNQVLKTNISRTLEPMNPFERRIIHAKVSEIEGVSSFSIGEEPNRRVVITAPGAKPAPRSGYHNNSRRDFSQKETSRGGYSNGRSPRRDSRPKEEGVENADQGGFDRERSGGRDGRRSGGRARQTQPASQGAPKQTPESEKTAGISFGKVEL